MEAIVIAIVPLIAVMVYISARFSVSARPVDRATELRQLHEQLAWHEDRLRRAKEKNWDDFMIEQIAAQLADTQGQLARVTTGAARR